MPPIQCKYCSAVAAHLSMACPDKPEAAKAGDAPPAEANEYGPTEIEDSKKLVEEMARDNLVSHGLLAPMPDPDKVKTFKPRGEVLVSSSEDVAAALGVYWHDALAAYCARRGVFLRMMNERNAYIEFLNDPPVGSVSVCRATIPCVCLEPVPEGPHNPGAQELC